SAIAPDVMAVHPASSFRSIKELVAKAAERELSYGTSGFGTAPYIGATYFFQEVAKIKLAHVPFTGGGPAVTAAIGNHVDVIVVGLPTAQKQIEEGLLRGLGIPAPKRNDALPNIPTFAEAGFPDLYSATWVGFFVPASTPDAVVAKLNSDINDALKSADSQERLKAIGFDPMSMTTAEAAEYVRTEVAHWGKMSRAIGFSTD